MNNPLVRAPLIALAILVACSASSHRSFAACPESDILYGCWPDGIMEGSTDPTHSFQGGAWGAGQPCPQGCYDLPSGVLQAQISDYCAGIVEAVDEYWVESMDHSTVFQFSADLHVTGNLSGLSAIGGRIGSVGIGLDTLVTTSPVDFHRYVALSRTAGEHFRLESILAVQAQGPFPHPVASGQATIRFTGLPQGAIVFSCQNYDQPVAIHTSTWGALRARYR